MQPYLNKCFGNIHGFEMSSKMLEITSLVSFEGEKLQLTRNVRVRGATEQWLGKSLNLTPTFNHFMCSVKSGSYQTWA